MYRVTFALVLVLMLATVLAVGASAQSGKHLALGVDVGFHAYTEDNVHSKNPSFSALYRFSLHPEAHKDGWSIGPSASVGLSSAKVDVPIGGVETRLGRVREIPVSVGGGPSYRHGPTKVGFTLVGGPVFNHFTEDNRAFNAYISNGQTLNNVKVKTGFAVKPGVSVWHDVSSMLGLHATASYFYYRPTAETTVDGTTTSDKWTLSKINFAVGFAVGIF